MIEEARVVVHQGHEPGAVADLLDADLLAGEDGAEIDLAPPEADAAAAGDDVGVVVERVVEPREAALRAR